MAALALFVAILPLLALMAFLSVMAAAKYQFNVTGYLLGLPLADQALTIRNGQAVHHEQLPDGLEPKRLLLEKMAEPASHSVES